MLLKNASTPVMEISTPAIREAVAVSFAESKNQGKVDVSNGQVIELKPAATFTKVTVYNPNTSYSAELPMAYVFNEATLKNSLVDNVYPNVPASNEMVPISVDENRVKVTYNDGFNGRLIDKLIQNSNMGRGLLCEELTIIGKDDTGAQTDDAILALDAAIQSYNCTRGDAIPINLDLGEANLFKCIMQKKRTKS
jgi:hypothetical protein